MRATLERSAATSLPARTAPAAPRRLEGEPQPAVTYRYGDVAVAHRCPCGGLTTAGGECESCRRRRLARETVDQRLRGPPDPASYGLTELALRLRERSASASLDASTRERVEARSGGTLGPVRVHEDTPSRLAAGLLGVRAFTIGQDVFLGEGGRAPAVLDHEAVHALQQRPWRGEPLTVAGAGEHEREAQLLAEGRAGTIGSRAPALMGFGPATTVACAFGFFLYAMTELEHKGDAYQHCWTSCKIATWCAPPLTSQVFTLILGLLKEIADKALGESELRDMANNASGVVCSLHYLTSCDACCEAKRRGGRLAAAEDAQPEAESALDAEAAGELGQAAQALA